MGVVTRQGMLTVAATRCRLRVELNYVKRFRYCEYLGKHFCPSCHQKGTAVIPAHVIMHWDFKRYPVSNFAGELLSSIYTDPLYDLATLNAKLVRKVKALARAKVVRSQLAALRSYFQTCRSGAGLLEAVESPAHLTSDPSLYSLEEVSAVAAA